MSCQVTILELRFSKKGEAVKTETISNFKENNDEENMLHFGLVWFYIELTSTKNVV